MRVRLCRFGGVSYFGFSYLTLVPIQAKMIDMSVMSGADVAWLDAYHQDVSNERPGMLARC